MLREQYPRFQIEIDMTITHIEADFLVKERTLEWTSRLGMRVLLALQQVAAASEIECINTQYAAQAEEQALYYAIAPQQNVRA